MTKKELDGIITDVLGWGYMKYTKETTPELLRRCAIELFLKKEDSTRCEIIRQALIQLTKDGCLKYDN